MLVLPQDTEKASRDLSATDTGVPVCWNVGTFQSAGAVDADGFYILCLSLLFARSLLTE